MPSGSDTALTPTTHTSTHPEHTHTYPEHTRTIKTKTHTHSHTTDARANPLEHKRTYKARRQSTQVRAAFCRKKYISKGAGSTGTEQKKTTRCGVALSYGVFAESRGIAGPKMLFFNLMFILRRMGTDRAQAHHTSA